MDSNQNIDLSSQHQLRKRGRPAGRNRGPLFQEERRARNAQYEKERRDENAKAAAMLAEAAGFEPNIQLIQLLDGVASFLKKEANRPASDDISALRRLNENLTRQIITLEERLQCEEEKPFTPSNCHEEVPVRTHSNDVLRKRVKLEMPRCEVYPTPSPEPLPEQSTALNSSLTLDSVLDDVISLEEEKIKKEIVKTEVPDYSQWSASSVLDDVLSLQEERKPTQVQGYAWSPEDFKLELL